MQKHSAQSEIFDMFRLELDNIFVKPPCNDFMFNNFTHRCLPRNDALGLNFSINSKILANKLFWRRYCQNDFFTINHNSSKNTIDIKLYYVFGVCVSHKIHVFIKTCINVNFFHIIFVDCWMYVFEAIFGNKKDRSFESVVFEEYFAETLSQGYLICLDLY